MKRALLFAAALAACHGASVAPPAGAGGPVASGDEIRFEPRSPQLAYLGYDTVRGRTEKVVATLPAELVMDEDHTVRVASPVTGRIQELPARAGDHVLAGQPLAVIASSDLAQATSDEAKAEAALTQATAALTRAQDLFDHQVIARKDLEQAENDAAAARAEAARARQRVALLGAGPEQADFILRAPIRGEILHRSANPGAEVRPDATDPLFVISALDTLWLTASLYQRDLPEVRPGNRLSFTTDAVPGQTFTATVTYVSGTLDSLTRTATLRAVLRNPARLLKPEMFGEARLLAPDRNGPPVVPTTALVTHGANTVVFVRVGPGRFARRTVTVTSDDGTLAAVSGGLELGEVVVTRGSILLAAELDQGS
ncbi:MAG TPA: efflux RND transporter periplasmic adaptor subunit [Gemmatimonadales bacterium]|nr:efflux RND transporter periplasmic adaptor subunit [Gemmatimonadales bacterium]